MVLFAVSPFAGPSLGPVVGGWIAVGGASWRWLFWVLTIFVSLPFHSYDHGLLAVL
jgi:MFS family permease